LRVEGLSYRLHLIGAPFCADFSHREAGLFDQQIQVKLCKAPEMPSVTGCAAMAQIIERIVEGEANSSGEPAVRGFLHLPQQSNGECVVLVHGAGSNCEAKLLVAVASALCETGFAVLRCDLPFRQGRPHGPPFPAGAARDREGLRRAIAGLKKKMNGRVFAGGHSYGGRQATMLLAEEPQEADGLLLLSYPLHPPRKPEELRVRHFPKLMKPAFFAHGDRDPFGSIEEMRAALKIIPAQKMLVECSGAGHDLLGKGNAGELAAGIAAKFASFVSEARK
jgi:predicted alpha/beta-hydrolase family hydrolase